MPYPPRRRTLLRALAVCLAALPCAAAALAVPPPPADRADRFGVYHWGADYSAWPGSPDRLSWGADRVAALGSRTLRVFLGGSEFYDVNPEPNARNDGFLRRIAAAPAYRRLFRDPRFRTYLLTVYPSAAFAVWRDGLDPAEAASEREQVARLGAALLADPAHAGKSFIVLNWEGDHATAALAADDPLWNDFTAWIEARAAGVRDARARVPGSAARLYSGLEFNFVEERSESAGRNVRCGEAGTRCVIDAVAPRVKVDYYSYSAWQSLNVKLAAPRASLRERLGADLAFALRAVRARRPQVTAANFILGEVGFARSLYGECAAARYLDEALAAAEAAGVSYAVVWQALDNRWRVEDGATRTLTSCDAPDWLLYGLHRGDDGGQDAPRRDLRRLPPRRRGGAARPLPADRRRRRPEPGSAGQRPLRAREPAHRPRQRLLASRQPRPGPPGPRRRRRRARPQRAADAGAGGRRRALGRVAAAHRDRAAARAPPRRLRARLGHHRRRDRLQRPAGLDPSAGAAAARQRRLTPGGRDAPQGVRGWPVDAWGRGARPGMPAASRRAASA